jgi:hypothetical protein
MNKKEIPPMTPLEMQQATEEIMRELGLCVELALKEYFPGSGFALLVFKFNKPCIGNYISNAKRASMIEALKETIKRLESNEDIPTASGTIH